ncbi:MAG: ABC transporter ATP-binding protein [Bifidobacteriaceae bacterium]|jgi:NitT/TauT family transport system ATP-binding protein|nr:ABC transporter ATP-binding protein [Bifidobacteriaceae bacterium]
MTAVAQTVIEIRDLTLHYRGAPAPTLGGVGFAVGRGEFVAVVGPSGAGKTTLLNCVSGLLPATSGEVRLEGKAITSPSRHIAIVFQDYSRSLFPWLTAAKNVSLPLKSRGVPRTVIAERVESSLASVGLSGQGGKYPWEMSGGMQQRVAIARALALEPHVLIMDEPMASVDAQTRSDLEDLVLRIWAERQVTVIFVTHDIDEAIYMSDRVVVLSTPPTTVHNVVEVPLPRPRNQLATKEDPRFGHLRADLFTEIRDLRARSAAPAAS